MRGGRLGIDNVDSLLRAGITRLSIRYVATKILYTGSRHYSNKK